MSTPQALKTEKDDRRIIKCVIWDLDRTLWDGVLLEDDKIILRQGMVEAIETLDSRGILQSIASKNDYDLAMAKLREFGLEEYFLYPQINWSSKVSSVRNIARLLNIGLASISLIDDEVFERQEVSFSLPEVQCLDPVNVEEALSLPEMNPSFITEDAKRRRRMYLSDLQRKQIEAEFVGPHEEFLASLNMILTISRVKEGDLLRAEELTLRTNQLNTTARVYTYDELSQFSISSAHRLLIAGLEDKYGSYGKIGLALLECGVELWIIKLLLMSCRVISRGTGSIMLNHLMAQAKNSGVRLLAEFAPNERNRMMQVAFKFAGFRETGRVGDIMILENDLKRIQPIPNYVKIRAFDDE